MEEFDFFYNNLFLIMKEKHVSKDDLLKQLSKAFNPTDVINLFERKYFPDERMLIAIGRYLSVNINSFFQFIEVDDNSLFSELEMNSKKKELDNMLNNNFNNLSFEDKVMKAYGLNLISESKACYYLNVDLKTFKENV